MPTRRHFLSAMPAAALLAKQAAGGQTKADTSRQTWIREVERMAGPVLRPLAERRLAAALPSYPARNREFAPLEAFARLTAGIAPWLERDRPEPWLTLTRECIDAATDPGSAAYMNWGQAGGKQPLVEGAYMAHTLLRAPNALWRELPPRVRTNLTRALTRTRQIEPNLTNNWVLFASLVEAALHHLASVPIVEPRVTYALEKLDQWFVGDGTYGDGDEFRWDYYNSYVMHSMLVDTLRYLGPLSSKWAAMEPIARRRATRYAAVLERMISPEGTYPVIGRSSVYRTAAFQTLSHMALDHSLPADLSPAQVRCALSAVIRRVLSFPGTYDANGFLTLGVCGKQPGLEDDYNSAGSPYIASLIFLPLGLPATDPFWTGEDVPWTQAKIWSGQDVPS
jgi:hypothetical protein